MRDYSAKRELIQFVITNSTDCDYNIPLMQLNVYSINATTKYSWNVTTASLACGTGSIVINSITYQLSYTPNLAGLLSALNALGFGFFCSETISGQTYIYTVDDTNIYGNLVLCTTTTTTTTAAPTTTTTTTTSTTTSTTTAAPTTTTTTTTSTTSTTTTEAPTTTTTTSTTSTTTTEAPTTTTTTSTTTSTTTEAPTTTTTTSTTSTTTTEAPTTTTTSTTTTTTTDTPTTTTTTTTTTSTTTTTTTLASTAVTVFFGNDPLGACTGFSFNLWVPSGQSPITQGVILYGDPGLTSPLNSTSYTYCVQQIGGSTSGQTQFQFDNSTGTVGISVGSCP